MNAQELNTKFAATLEAIKNEYTNLFPKGFIYCQFEKGINEPIFYIQTRLIGSIEDIPYNIVDNDPFLTKIKGHINFNKNVIEIESLVSGLHCKPEKDSHYAMRRVKCKFRKVTKTFEQFENDAVKIFKKYFTQMRNTLDENKQNVYGAEKIQQYL